jgi:hypothetical protein
MWLVLAVAVGAAALINHEVRKRHRAVLHAPRTLGEMRIRLPVGWNKSPDPADENVLIHLSEPGEGAGGRQLLVLSRPTEGFVPPMQCLDRLDGGALKTATADAQEIQMAGYPGVLVRRRARVGRAGQEVEAGVVQACVSFPWRQAVVIHLEGMVEDDDADLVQRIASSIALQGRPSPVQEKTLTLPHMAVPVPDGWRVAGENDPNRIGGQLIYAQQGQWISAEVIPCYLPDDREPAIAALVAANDPDWLDARIRSEGGQWRLDLPGDRKESLLQARVLTGPHRQGMIVIFRGLRTDLPLVDQAWGTLTQGVRFGRVEDWDQLLERGARAVAQWARRSPEQLLATREDQWWLWHRSGPAPYMGWMNLQWLSAAGGAEAAASPWRAVWEMRWRETDGTVVRMRQTVEGRNETYSSQMEQWRSDDGAASLIPIERESTRVHDGALSWRSASRRVDAAAPPQFLGGGWLPLLLPKVADQTMVLKSESLLFQRSQGTPLDIIVRPAPAKPADSSGEAPAGGRTVMIVQVNGSGDRSRWSFGADGELQSIDCARGLRMLAAGAQDLRLDFHDDARMGP